MPHSSTSSRNRSSKDSENENFLSFNKSPEGSDLEVLFNSHFKIDRLGDQVLDNMLQDSREEDSKFGRQQVNSG